MTDHFTLDEQYRLLQAAEASDAINALGISLCFHLGIRLGELCGLQWQDIDLDTGTVRIQRTIQRVVNPAGTPKTHLAVLSYDGKSPVRTLTLPKLVTNLLATHKPPIAKGYVISRQGEPIEPRNMQFRFKTLQEHAHVTPKKFYAIRHTFAIRAIESGCDLFTLSELLGHTSLQMTEKHYGYLVKKSGGLERMLTGTGEELPGYLF